MAYCENCGAIIKDSANYCGYCGSKTGNIKETKQDTNNKRQSAYDGKIHKCPNCGATLESFTKKCIECGYELRSTEGTTSITDFSKAYSNTKSNSEKIDLIRTFAIPNTKEDILEFVILASSNINIESYANEKVVDSEGISQQDISDAWLSKIEQAYRKAEIVLQGDSHLSSIDRIYNEKKKALSRAKKVGKKSLLKNWLNNKTLLWCVIGVLSTFVLLGLVIIPRTVNVSKLEKQVEIIEELIDAGDYDSALRRAEMLRDDSGWSSESEKKWEKIREAYITRIEDLQEKAIGNVRIPTINIDGKQYSDVELIYEKAGFSNVTTEKVPDLVTGWINDEGEVKEVLIGGSTTYEPGSYVDKNIKVVIKYHGYSD